VLPSRQREGTGTALIKRGLGVLADRGAPMVFLEGSPDYYGRLGFTPAVHQGFRKPSFASLTPPSTCSAYRHKNRR